MEQRYQSISGEKKFKFIIIGDPSVGKTTLFWKYTENELVPSSKGVSTIDFKMKTTTYKNQIIKLYIWDTAGQEKYRAIVSTYFKGCNGVLLVFDETNPASFDGIVNSWYPLCQSKNDDCNYVLLGNKIDAQRNVNKELVKNWTDKTGIKYIPVSCLENKNVADGFEELIKMCVKKDEASVANVSVDNREVYQKAKSFTIGKKGSANKEQAKKKCC